MKVVVEPSGLAVMEFETEAELQAEYQKNLSSGGVSLPTQIKFAEFTTITLTLKLLGKGEVTVPASIVRLLEGALAVYIKENPAEILATLLKPKEEESGKGKSTWDRVRELSHLEKILLAPKADRSERAVLVQDNDTQIILYLLKNPRITLEEVVRVARSGAINSQVADFIAKTAQWSSNLEIRIALAGNSRTPAPLAIKLLPTLPEQEIRKIAKATAASQSLKQAALKLLINK